MNKKLFEKVKGLCKDTGLSEKYLNAITEKMGGSIADDSTDETEMDNVANQIADIAKESQGEATRWVQKKNKANPDNDDVDPKDDDEGGKGKGKPDKSDPNDERLKKLEAKIAELEAEKAKGERKSAIAASMEKHKIPAFLRDRLAMSISDEEDIDAAVTAIKQEMITNGLPDEGKEGPKAASEKQIDEAADSLLESITVK